MKIFPKPTKDEINELIYTVIICACAWGFFVLCRRLGFSATDSANFMYLFIYIITAIFLVVGIVRLYRLSQRLKIRAKQSWNEMNGRQ